jgi:hypothetical protein
MWSIEKGGPDAISSMELFTSDLKNLFRIIGAMRMTDHNDTIASGLRFPGEYWERQLRDIPESSGLLVDRQYPMYAPKYNCINSQF